MNSPIECIVQQEEDGMRLDTFVALQCGVSRAVAQQLIAGGNIQLNEKTPVKSSRVISGDLVGVTIPKIPDIPFAQQGNLTILYEDDAVLVVNKPKGLVVHPSPGNQNGTLANFLSHHCGGNLSTIGGEQRPGIVHRLDKDTSGLLVAAKTDAAHLALAEQFSNRTVKRLYQAVVYGRMKEHQGEVSAPIGRHPKDRKKMAVQKEHSKQATTRYTVLREYNGFSHLSLQLLTGRTHQIRVHMAWIGHPVAGDAQYGPKKVLTFLHGQCLHAKTLGFVHPKTGSWMEFDSELPPYFQDFLHKLERQVRL